MNCKEWHYLCKTNRHLLDFTYYNNTRKLQRSLQYNSNSEATVIHHLRDTEEQRKYNDEHYELWSHNLDGTFEYGKYVTFVTEEWHLNYHHYSEETRKKIGNSNKKKWEDDLFRQMMHSAQMSSWSQERRRKISVANKGRHLSEEHKKKVSDGNKGKVVSEETRKKISNALSGENHYLYGKRLSDEHKKHISDSHIGKCWITDDGRRRISEYARNHVASNETRALLRERNSVRLKFMSEKYLEHKLSNGTMSWNTFQKEFKNMTDEFIAWQNLHRYNN